MRVASVPEFLAKQLLKQFGFPWHVAPGEAEAECALLQKEGIVDAVLSEDVDTMMFGSGVTLRSWTPEGSSGKTPTHVNVYRAEETAAKSGMDGQGMVLVALMSGGDYIPEGIPGCGPKVACDAARAGFGKELCALGRSDKDGLRAWRERLQHEIRTNESKLFSRKNKTLVIPEDFPSAEVLGYYIRPCVSSAQKLAQLRGTLRWDQDIDFPALRSFTGDAFDWRCLGGAKKFIRNLAPAMLVRRLRLIAETAEDLEPDQQAGLEAKLVAKVHGKRNHSSTDGELELRISFTPSDLVPIDLDIEDEEDDFLLAGEDRDGSDQEDGIPTVPSETPTEASDAEEAPASPSKRARQPKPYDPNAAEKLWILKDFLQLGCPLLVEDYEAQLRVPRETAKSKRKGAANTESGRAPKLRGRPAKAKAGKGSEMPANALMRHMQVTKAASVEPEMLANKPKEDDMIPEVQEDTYPVSGFKLPGIRVPSSMMRRSSVTTENTLPSSHPITCFAPETRRQRTPKKMSGLKRPSPDLSTPRSYRGRGQITSYFSPTPKAKRTQSQGDLAKDAETEVIDLLSSSPMQEITRDQSPTPRRERKLSEDELPPLPGTVTKRRKRGPLKKSLSAPVQTTSPLFMRQGSDDKLDWALETRESAREESPQRSSSPTRIRHEENYANRHLETNDEQSKMTSPNRPTDMDFPSSNSLPTPPAESSSPALLPSNPMDIRSARREARARSPLPTTNPTAITLSSSPAQPFAIPPPRQAQAALAEREPSPQPAVHDAPKASKKSKSTHIILRPSLPGTWRAATTEEAEALDLTGDGSGVRAESSRAGKGKRPAGKWRASGVEVLDLTID